MSDPSDSDDDYVVEEFTRGQVKAAHAREIADRQMIVRAGWNGNRDVDPEIKELTLDELAEGALASETSKMSLDRALASITAKINNKKTTDSLTPHLRKQLFQLSEYVRLLLKGKRAVDASLQIAAGYADGEGTGLARTVCQDLLLPCLSLLTSLACIDPFSPSFLSNQRESSR
jgi:hypothetical protein